MVLLSLGSGLITALMAQAKPARDALDLSCIADDRRSSDRQDNEDAVLLSDKTTSPQ
jgi:hypothetical protein